MTFTTRLHAGDAEYVYAYVCSRQRRPDFTQVTPLSCNVSAVALRIYTYIHIHTHTAVPCNFSAVGLRAYSLDAALVYSKCSNKIHIV